MWAWNLIGVSMDGSAVAANWGKWETMDFLVERG